MLNLKEQQKLDAKLKIYKRWCKHCGHSIVFPPSAKRNKMICTHCGKYIYKNDTEEFKELIKKELKNEQ